ncbi:MAG: hypothetical protein J6A21_04300 [Lentisphaeria bacterium]|nr:hypothetical protein [Lentisphaeria bacterium]
MGFLKDRIWSWGYVMNFIPGSAPFTFGKSRCSLETQAEFLGAERCFYMNSMFSRKYVETYFKTWDPEVIANCVDERLSDAHMQRLKKMKRVFCTLEHQNYVESAVRIAKASLVCKNICGVHFDDFNSANGGTLIKEIRDRIKEINPALKIAAVTYSHHDLKEYEAGLPYIDVYSRWCWVPSFDYWNYHADDIRKLRDFVGEGKKIFQGIYMHDFGSSGRPVTECYSYVPLEVFKKSVETICEHTCTGILDGIILPQAAYYSFSTHREHVQFLKEYVDWADGTMTELGESTAF